MRKSEVLERVLGVPVTGSCEFRMNSGDIHLIFLGCTVTRKFGEHNTGLFVTPELCSYSGDQWPACCAPQRRVIRTIAGSVVFAQETCSNRRGIADYDSPLVTDRALLGLITDWEGFLQSDEEGPMKKIRKATRTGRPGGERALVTTPERPTGRDLSK